MSSANNQSTLAWGFCRQVANIIAKFKDQTNDFVWISDHPKADYNLFHVLRASNLNKYLTANSKSNLKNNSHFEFTPEEKERFRIFYSRHWYPQRHSNAWYEERLNLYAHFFSSIIKKHNVKKVILSNIPHEGPEYVLSIVAKRLKIPTISFFQTIFKMRAFVTHDLEIYNRSDCEKIKTISKLSSPRSESLEIIEEGTKSIGKWFYLPKPTKKPQSLLRALFKNARYYFKKKRVWLNIPISIDTIRYYFELKKVPMIDSQDLNKKFVYFPLHLEPELTASSLTSLETTQANAIQKLSQILPNDWIIILKENPRQSGFMRPKKFFDQIKKIPNVKWAPLTMDTVALTKASQFVATIVGTVGWEALLFGKKVLIFGDAWYKEFTGITAYTPSMTIQTIEDCTTVDSKTIINEATQLLTEIALPICVDNDYFLTLADKEKLDNEKNLIHLFNAIHNHQSC